MDKLVILTLDNMHEIAKETGEKYSWLKVQYWEAKRKGKVVQVRLPG